FDVGQAAHRAGTGQWGVSVRGGGGAAGLDGFLQRVPSGAMRAFSLPLGAGAAAFGTDINGTRLGHVRKFTSMASCVLHMCSAPALLALLGTLRSGLDPECSATSYNRAIPHEQERA